MRKKIIDYIKRNRLFIIIVLTLIIGNICIWWKALSPIDETWRFIVEDPELIFSAMLVVTSIAIAIYAGLQHHLEKKNVILAAWDRRIQVYDAMKSVVANSIKSGKIDSVILVEMLRKTKYAQFLFKKDDQIFEYINEFWDKGCLWQLKEKKLEFPKGKEDKIKLINEKFEIHKWFRDQDKIIDKKFEDYLRIE